MAPLPPFQPPSEPVSGPPAAAPGPHPLAPAPRTRPLLRITLVFCLLLAVVAAGMEGARRWQAYSQKLLNAKLAQASIAPDFTDRPAFLHPEILRSILMEVGRFAYQSTPGQRPGDPPVSNYRRLCDPLDSRVLGDLAKFFEAHRTVNNNAWLRQIVSIQRVYDEKKNRFAIRLQATFRRPVALVAQGNTFSLIDDEAVRLPGAYDEQDARAMVGHAFPGSGTLLMIRGIDEPLSAPGNSLTSPEARAGLALVRLLAVQRYALQIAAVNVSNFGGRMDKLASWINLDTVFANANSVVPCTQVWWGRPPDEESFLEVHAPAKLQRLQTLFQRFGRIDAGQAYVDVRFDQVMIPRAPEPGTPPTAPPPAPIPPRTPRRHAG